MFTVMIVDDQEVIRMQMKRLKIWGETSGFVITEEAKNGQDAIEIYQRNPVDLIITDIRMPKVDGIEFLRLVTELDNKPCVVFLSDFSEFNYAREGMKYGAFDYLVKPVEEQEIKVLLSNVKRYLDEKKRTEDIMRGYTNDLYKDNLSIFAQQITQYIIKSDSQVNQLCCELIDWIEDMFAANTIKKIHMVLDLQNEILNAICIQYSWITMMKDNNEILSTQLNTTATQVILKEEMIRFANILINLINEFQYIYLSNDLIENVCKYVLKNIEKEVTLTSIAETLYMNKTYLSEVFKQKTGKTIGEFITKVKIERSKKLLRENKLRNYEIAYLVGYKDVDYFSKLFKKSEGISPGQYRENPQRL